MTDQNSTTSGATVQPDDQGTAPAVQPAPPTADQPTADQPATDRRPADKMTKPQLVDEVERLRAENERLRLNTTTRAGAAPERPSFGMSEGTRQELAERGIATDPYTGRIMTAEGEGVKRTREDTPEEADARRRLELERREAEGRE